MLGAVQPSLPAALQTVGCWVYQSILKPQLDWLKVVFNVRLSVGPMLWLRACVSASIACAHAPLISADSFAVLTFFSDVFRLVAACHTWVSLAITADDENCPRNAREMEPERELSQLSPQNTDDTDATMPDPEGTVLADGQVENGSNVDAVTWCGRLGRSTVPVVALFELLNFLSTTSLVAVSPAARDSSWEQIQSDKNIQTLVWSAHVQTVPDHRRTLFF